MSTQSDARQSPENVRGSYHRAHLSEDRARAVLWKVLGEHLAGYVPPDARVLELGAGYCYWINDVRASRRVAVDIWDELPEHAGPDVRAVVHDLNLGLPALAEAPFDVVMASNVLEHFEPDMVSQLCGELYRILRDGGRLIVIQPNFRFAYRRYFDDYTHRSIFTDVSMANLLRAHGFGIECVQARFLPYSLQGKEGAVHPWLIRAYLHSPLKPFAGQMLVVARKGPAAR